MGEFTLKSIKELRKEYDILNFNKELLSFSYNLGIYRGKTESSDFNHILMPFVNVKETVASMEIEGTQVTYNDAFEANILQTNNDQKNIEIRNFLNMMTYCCDELISKDFSHDLIKKIHKFLFTDISNKILLGEYKEKQNFIKNTKGTLVYTPPKPNETVKYMDELINYMNEDDSEENYIIKAAIIHSQFESIHPFEDGNGRVGRVLVGLYLFKKKLIHIPIFYISEAISRDKPVYYNELTKSRTGQLNSWIKYFINKCDIQVVTHINYIRSIDKLYKDNKVALKDVLITNKLDKILNSIFVKPIMTSATLAEDLNISTTQAKRYLDLLEEKNILYSDDSKRNKHYYFSKLLELYNS